MNKFDWNRIKLNPREFLLCVFTAIALMVAFTMYWYGARKNEMVGIKSQISEVKGSISKKENLRDELLGSSATKSVAQQDIELDDYLETNRRLANLINEFSNKSESTFFNVKKIESVQQESVNEFDKTLFKLDVNASFLAIGRFLERLESSKILNEVQSVDISRIDSELKRCQAQIQLFGYVVR